jgi:hypothetical protein
MKCVVFYERLAGFPFLLHFYELDVPAPRDDHDVNRWNTNAPLSGRLWSWIQRHVRHSSFHTFALHHLCTRIVLVHMSAPKGHPQS